MSIRSIILGIHCFIIHLLMVIHLMLFNNYLPRFVCLQIASKVRQCTDIYCNKWAMGVSVEELTVAV